DQQRITPRLKQALDSMIWQGTAWDEAAVEAGLTNRAMRLAMTRQSVLSYLKQGRVERLAGEHVRAVHRLSFIMTTNDHMAGVQAAKTMLLLGGEPTQTQR